MVSDNANNITKAVEMAFIGKKHITCFAPTLNLVAERDLEESGNLIMLQKVKELYLG